jgi:hypothetical protein
MDKNAVRMSDVQRLLAKALRTAREAEAEATHLREQLNRERESTKRLVCKFLKRIERIENILEGKE